VRRADPLEDRVAHGRDQNSTDDLWKVPDGRRGRVGQDEEGEKERGVEIRRMVDLDDPRRIGGAGVA